MKIFTLLSNCRKYAIAFLAVLLCLMIKPEVGFGQTTITLLNPTGDGGFETGTTLAANTWTGVNSGGLGWYVGSAGGVFAGSRAVFIGTSATTYTGTGSATVVHFYRDIPIPANATNISLSFYLKNPTVDNNADYTYVFTTTTANTPVVGTTPGAGYTNVYTNTNTTYSAYTLQTVNLSNALAGTTVRLVFTFKNNGSSPRADPAIDNISLTYTPIATGIISGSPFCQGTTNVTVPFTASGTFNSGNVYTAQLSDNTGSFASPTAIGTLISTSSGALNITGCTIPAAAAGNAYRIRVVSSNPSYIGVDNGTNLTINAAPVISGTGQPADQTTCAGTSKTFTVTLSSGTSPTYQWQYSPDNGVTAWANVATNVPSAGYTYSAATSGSSNTLTVTTPINASTGTYYYRCVITVSGCSQTTSASAMFTVNATPTATLSYSGSPFCTTVTSVMPSTSTNGSTVNFTSSPSLSSAALNPATGELNPSVITPGTYSITYNVTNGTCTNSASTSVIINANPSVTAPSPSTASVCATGTNSVTFSVTGSGGSAGNPPTYQWQYSANGSTGWANVANGTPANINYTNSTTAALTITPASNAGNGTYYYRCVVSVNGCSATPAISTNATLTVYGQPSAANAGVNQVVACGSLSTTLAATNPSVGTGTWSVVSGPAGSSFGNVNAYNSSFTAPANGPSAVYTLRWTVSNGTCASTTDDVTITFNYTLNGLYSVGSTNIAGEQGHFNTLTRAADNYNTCLGGNVTFALTDATYSTAETFPIIFGNTAASNTKTLTIKPNTGVTATITGSSGSSSANALIQLNGADYVTIDGSNNGTTSKNLTIKNTSTYNILVPFTSVLWIASRSASDGATNNTIKNCNITGSGTTTTWAGIAAGDNTSAYESQADFPNNNNTIQNCAFTNAVNGIYIYGASSNDQNWTIDDNSFGTLYEAGVLIQNAKTFSIDNNIISGLNANAGIANVVGGIQVINCQSFTVTNNSLSSISNSSVSNITAGIELSGTNQAFSIQNNTISTVKITGGANIGDYPAVGIHVTGTVSGSTTNSISYNKISSIINTAIFPIINTEEGGAQGIYLNSTTSNLSVFNNFIANVTSYGSNNAPSSSANGSGILIDKGSGYNIYYNSVSLSTNQNSGSSITAAITVTNGVTTANAINLVDNIFSNTETTGTKYSIYSTAANTVFKSMDYNDYWGSGSKLAYRSGNLTDLAAIQSATGFGTVNNVHSVNVQPVFTSSTDLHLVVGSNASLDNLGTPVSTPASPISITDDIDLETRNAYTPDMGADEFSSCASSVYTWLGTSDANWNNPANWCTNNGTVPSITTSVIIPSGTPFSPSIYAADATALSLTILSGANLTTTGTYNLNLGSNSIFTNNGTFNASGSTTGAVVFSNVGTVTGSSATTFNNITESGGLTLSITTITTITGNFQINSGAVVNNSPTYTNTSTLTYNVSGTYSVGLEWNNWSASSITAGSALPQTVTVKSGTVSIPNSGAANRSVAGDLNINSSAALQFAAAGTRDLYIGGSWTNNAGISAFTANGRTVSFVGNINQTITGNTTFYDLTQNQGGSSNLIYAAANTTITHNLTVNAGTMTPNSGTLVEFTGAGNLAGGVNKRFYNLQIDNTSTMTITSGGVDIANNFTNNGGYTYSGTSKLTTFNGSGVTQSLVTAAAPASTIFWQLSIGNTQIGSTATTLNATGDFTISGGTTSSGMNFNTGSKFVGNTGNTVNFITAPAAVVVNSGSGTTANFYNAVTSVSLNLGSGISTINNNLQLNTGGSISTNAPNYANNAASTLTYNTGVASLTPLLEWNANTSTPGIGQPYNVTVQNNGVVLPSVSGSRTVPGLLTIAAGSSLAINNNNNLLNVNSGFAGTGNLKGGVAGSTSNLTAGGNGTIYFDATANYLKNLITNSGANLSLGNALNITAGVAYGIMVSNGALASGGFLTLKSDVNGTAQVGQCASGGTITGNVTVERYFPAVRAWRFVAIPFTSTSQTINAAWQEGNVYCDYSPCSGTYNGTAGFGTEITYNNDCTYNGYDYHDNTYKTSIQTYQNNDWRLPSSGTKSNLVSEPSSYNPANPGYPAYSLFVRGDRTICLNGINGSNNTVLRPKGVLNQNGSSVSHSLPSGNTGDYILIGNPYACTIKLDDALFNRTTNNIDKNSFYTYNPNAGTTGGYVTHSLTGGTSVPYVSTVDSYIQSGEAFMVKLNGTGTPTINFQESDKLPGQAQVNTGVFGLRAALTTQPSSIVYANLTDTTNAVMDGVACIFDNKYSAAVDDIDASKKWNEEIENMAIIRHDTALAIEFRPLPKATDTVFFRLYLRQHPYRLKVFSQNLAPAFSSKAWIVDKYLGTETEVNLRDTSIYDFTPNSDTNSYRNRFMLVFSPAKTDRVVKVDSLIRIIIAHIYPNPVSGRIFRLVLDNARKDDYTVNIYTMKGSLAATRKVSGKEGANSWTIPVPLTLTSGSYTVQVLNSGGVIVSALPLIISR